MKAKNERTERLMPNGIPRYVRCYDGGSGMIDRYTVVFGKKRIGPSYRYGFLVLQMSEDPTHPQGVGIHDEADDVPDRSAYSHLGKKIRFEDLPEKCQKVVIQDYKELWNLK